MTLTVTPDGLALLVDTAIDNTSLGVWIAHVEVGVDRAFRFLNRLVLKWTAYWVFVFYVLCGLVFHSRCDYLRTSERFCTEHLELEVMPGFPDTGDE